MPSHRDTSPIGSSLNNGAPCATPQSWTPSGSDGSRPLGYSSNQPGTSRTSHQSWPLPASDAQPFGHFSNHNTSGAAAAGHASVHVSTAAHMSSTDVPLERRLQDLETQNYQNQVQIFELASDRDKYKTMYETLQRQREPERSNAIRNGPPSTAMDSSTLVSQLQQQNAELTARSGQQQQEIAEMTERLEGLRREYEALRQEDLKLSRQWFDHQYYHDVMRHAGNPRAVTKHYLWEDDYQPVHNSNSRPPPLERRGA